MRIDLDETITPTAVQPVAMGDLTIAGRVHGAGFDRVLVRVTDGAGQSTQMSIALPGKTFRCRYPSDFTNAAALAPGFFFVDATVAPAFDASAEACDQAEATVLVIGPGADGMPEFPSPFTADLLDAAGRTDATSTEWGTISSLTNLYMRSRAARLCRVGRPDFDLARAEDLQWYKDNLTLYEFDHRDRDWSSPLGHRVRRTFWQAVWNTWFNASNNHPKDGNPQNKESGNFVPYAFANDFPDILMLYLMRLDLVRAMDDNLDAICREGLENFLVMQHREDSNFAVEDKKGRRHTYTAGAFRYGMFEDGHWLTEGKGWFYNPEHFDYINGGVFNGRAVWCLGEGLKRYRTGPLAVSLRDAIALGLRFCLFDAQESGYAHKTSSGLRYWYDPGESGYLLLGMLAACEADPRMVVRPRGDEPPLELAELTARTLDAMVELMQPHGQWQLYGDKDPMVIAALADGVRIFPDHPHASRWRESAIRAADSWLAVQVDPKEYPAPLVHFAPRRLTKDRMTFLWDWTDTNPGRNFVILYISGHWIHALAKVYDMTHEERYRRRAEAMVRYLCGANPWHVRLLNELGAVYNWVDDTDGDGIEDRLKQDMYPESTAFCQIGINHLIRAIQRERRVGNRGLGTRAAD